MKVSVDILIAEYLQATCPHLLLIVVDFACKAQTRTEFYGCVSNKSSIIERLFFKS
jgi:hypothetical protein